MERPPHCPQARCLHTRSASSPHTSDPREIRQAQPNCASRQSKAARRREIRVKTCQPLATYQCADACGPRSVFSGMAGSSSPRRYTRPRRRPMPPCQQKRLPHREDSKFLLPKIWRHRDTIWRESSRIHAARTADREPQAGQQSRLVVRICASYTESTGSRITTGISRSVFFW